MACLSIHLSHTNTHLSRGMSAFIHLFCVDGIHLRGPKDMDLKSAFVIAMVQATTSLHVH